MEENEFSRLLDEYLDPPNEPNPTMEGVCIIWERDNPKIGSLHILQKHGVTEDEVEQVLKETPPEVETRQHFAYPERTLFWGATRHKRWLFIVCEDYYDNNMRYLSPLTAFEPEKGIKYWGIYK